MGYYSAQIYYGQWDKDDTMWNMVPSGVKYLGYGAFATSNFGVINLNARTVESTGSPKGSGYYSVHIRTEVVDGHNVKIYDNISKAATVEYLSYEKPMLYVSNELIPGLSDIAVGQNMSVRAILNSAPIALLDQTKRTFIGTGNEDDDIQAGAKGGYVFAREGKDSVTGSDAAEQLYGDEYSATVTDYRLRQHDDFLFGKLGDDRIDGGMGIDTARLRGNMDSYKFSYGGNPTEFDTKLATTFYSNGPDGKDQFVDTEILEFDDNSAPLMKLHLVVQRGQDGTLKSVDFYVDGELRKHLKVTKPGDGSKGIPEGSYDDATPILTTKEQGLKYGYEATYIRGGDKGDRFFFDNVPGRNSIELHTGNATGDSEGCVVVTKKGFLGAVAKEINKAIAEAGMIFTSEDKRGEFYDLPVPVTIDIRGHVDQPKAGFGDDPKHLKATDTKKHFYAISFDDKLDGETPGISKDMVLHVTAKADKKLNFSITTGPGVTYDEKTKQYAIVILAGDTSRKLEIALKSMDTSQDHTLKLNIVDVDLFRPSDAHGYAENNSNILRKLLLDDSTLNITVSKAAPAADAMPDLTHEANWSGDLIA